MHILALRGLHSPNSICLSDEANRQEKRKRQRLPFAFLSFFFHYSSEFFFFFFSQGERAGLTPCSCFPSREVNVLNVFPFSPVGALSSILRPPWRGCACTFTSWARP